ncbi:Predicted dienelactone hydrolase [Rhizobium sp. NFR07]|nr:Predicted dienelactone hydrolase [Rhizobium sp. NFR07]
MPFSLLIPLASPVLALAAMGLVQATSALPLEVTTRPNTISAKVTHPAAETSVQVGVRQISATSKERGGDIEITVWYPAQADGEPVMLGESVFFEGTASLRDASIAERKFPLVLLSHGAGLAGNPQAMSWIATPLASQGFVVAAPTHPGNSGRNRSAAETMKIWLRPGDLSDTLDAIEKDPTFSGHIDTGRVGTLGLSMGGGTALAIAGARIDPRLLAGYCDTDMRNASLCDWVRQSGVDLHAMDMQSAGRDNSDRRIRFAMAIDPAPVDVFDAESFADVSIPVSIVNLGAQGKIPTTADASGLVKAIANSSYTTINDASHYSLFAECRPGAAEMAEAEKIGDPICMDGGGRSRRELHAQMIDMTVGAFSQAVKADAANP